MILQEINNKKPIIHCITNYVASNLQANGLLAVGASPIMADEQLEVEDITQISDALLLNIGTINERVLKSMIIAGKKANSLGIPVVLDPVGVGASAYRKAAVKQLLQEVQFTLIRCNQSELATLADRKIISRGVDAGEEMFNFAQTAMVLSVVHSTMIAVSGETDYIVEQQNVKKVTGGNALIEKMTGSGCLLSSLCTAALTVSDQRFEAIYQLHHEYKHIAENAFSNDSRLGEFQVNIINELHSASSGGMNK